MDTLRLPREPRRIAVLRALYLGDLLCAVPALNALDRRFPEAEITLIGLPWTRELTDRLPAVDHFLEFAGYPGLPELPYDEQRTAAFIEHVREGRYDIAMQLHGSGSVVNDLVADFGADLTVGFCLPGNTQLSLTLPWEDDESEIERWLHLVALLGAESGNTAIDVPIFDKERRRAEDLLDLPALGSQPIIGFHCGSKLDSRRWPADRFADLGDELSRRHDARIVLTGSHGERHLAREVSKRMRAKPLDLVGKTSLGTFLALIGMLDLLVTNDTGASHVAAATRTRSVVLFGPSRPSRWAPLDRTLHTVIDARVFAEPDLPDDRYLGHLPVAPVLDACSRTLDAVRGHGPGRISSLSGAIGMSA